MLFLPACDAGSEMPPGCGNGKIELGEQCDVTVGDASCASVGYYNSAGTLRCFSSCAWDLRDCGGKCGDGLVDAMHGEVCDGANLNGQSCTSLGSGTGELACDATCGWNYSGCSGICGNGIIEGVEGCEDGGTLNGDGCSATCEVEDGWTCQDGSPSVCTTICGDGLQRGDEICDGTNMGGVYCSLLGYHGGVLACTEACEFDLTDCETYGRCGDGIVQASAGETCDGGDLRGATCMSQGYYGGILTCSSECTLDRSACEVTGRCGDGLTQSDYGETCDGADLASKSCQTFGFYQGVLTCDSECQILASGCRGRCGDSVVQSSFGEQCDGANLNGQTCVSRGYWGGELACNAQCRFEVTDCANTGRCGDGIIQSTYGEICDGANLDGATCISLGHRGGTLGCAGDCLFNTGSCWGYCGDGEVQAAYGEFCDPPDYGFSSIGEFCFSGDLNCDASCQYLPTNCVAAVEVATSTYNTCAVLADGTARCWGNNSQLQVGDGNSSTTSRVAPSQVSGLNNVVQISAGYDYTCAILSDGTARCWGNNYYCTLGDGTSTDRPTPTAVSGLVNAVSISAGQRHTCARLSDGTVRCWGTNGYGQLGDGTSTTRCTPTTVTGLSGTASVATANYTSCALLSNGTARCWGYNYYGTIGDGTTVNRSTPTAVSGIINAVQLAPGSYSSCAVITDGTVRCWGYNGNGQIGDGTTSNRLSPVPVTDLENAVQVSVGGDHVCATLDDGTAVCWGRNTSGQLGDGTTTQHLTPAPVPGLHDVVSLQARGVFDVGPADHTCALLTNGTLRCWGANGYGQLGTGNTTQSLVPLVIHD